MTGLSKSLTEITLNWIPIVKRQNLSKFENTPRSVLQKDYKVLQGTVTELMLRLNM